MSPAPVKNVYVVLKNPSVSLTGLADLLGGKATPQGVELAGIFEDELDAAKLAGATAGTWYVEQPLVPQTSR